MDLEYLPHLLLAFVTVRVIVLALVLKAEFINGWTDAPNAIATVVVTGALPVRIAVPGGVILNALGVMSGTAVAATIGKGIVQQWSVTPATIGAAMVAIILWGSLAAKNGWPVSKSHALLSGIAGAALAGGGINALMWDGWKLVLIGMLASLAAGFMSSLSIGTILVEVLARVPASSTKRVVDYAHIVSASLMAFAHGMNDGQKFIGIFVLVLSIGAESSGFHVPWWVVALCSFTMGAGTAFGGYRIIATVGKKLGDLQSWQGLVATSCASSVILVASHFGIPLSTTHTITTSIAGAHSAKGLANVRWSVMADIVKAWILTFFWCPIIAFGAAKVVLMF